MDLSLYSEEEILDGCIAQERFYQELLYRRHAPKMYGICLSYACDRSLAQDMLQEGFIKVYRNIGSFKREGSLEGWIRKIVVNTALDLLRQRKNIEKYLTEEVKETGASEENRALPDLQMNDILSLVERLPEGARVIFNLVALDGYTHKEIAEELDISIGTSKSQYNRARMLLQEWLRKFK